MKLTKAQIVDSVSDQIGYTKHHSFELIQTLLEIMKKTLESGEDVMISNFGKFCVRVKKERRGRNPSTGADMLLRPRKVVAFRWSGNLKKRLNGQ